MSEDPYPLTDSELEAVVRFLDEAAAPHSYTTTDGGPLATGAERLRRNLTYRVLGEGRADDEEQPDPPDRLVVPVEMLRAASKQMHGRDFTVDVNSPVWLLLYHLFSAMGGAMGGSQDPPAVLVVETPKAKREPSISQGSEIDP